MNFIILYAGNEEILTARSCGLVTRWEPIAKPRSLQMALQRSFNVYKRIFFELVVEFVAPAWKTFSHQHAR
jgi:hypothetical protein